MRLNQIREITSTPLSRRINRLLKKKDSRKESKNFSHYLTDKDRRRISSSGEKKEQKEQQKNKARGKDSSNGKGQFIDVRV